MSIRRRPNKSYLTPNGKVLQWITDIHLFLYEKSRGYIGTTIFQIAEEGYGFPIRPMKILLITTTGRKSGLKRVVPLPYFEYDGRLLLVGSFAGGPKHPAWIHNIRANPEVHIQKGRESYDARAVLLEGDDRDRYFDRLAGDWPRYGVYQKSTPRQIPLVEILA